MRKIILLLNTLLMIFFSIYFSLSLAGATHPRQTINILTWWGYLDYPEIINKAEEQCKVKISFDEYYSNDEFLRRWQGQNDYYDIIIFSNTIYTVIKDKIPNYKESELWKQSLSYNPVIKLHYNKDKYSHNIVYFIHSLTGFLWNPKNINLSNNDSVLSIFNKASQKYVVIIDDPVEGKKLIETSLGLKQTNTPINNILTIANFKKVVQNANVYITNNYSQIYQKANFAFSFSWSGEAVVDLMESNINYKFLIHKKLSYVSSDLLAQTSNKKSSQCVAKFLTDKKTLNNLQNKDYYFSPYTDYSQVNNKIFRNIYKEFIASLPSLLWLDDIKEYNYENTNQSWQLIKIFLNNSAYNT